MKSWEVVTNICSFNWKIILAKLNGMPTSLIRKKTVNVIIWPTRIPVEADHQGWAFEGYDPVLILVQFSDWWSAHVWGASTSYDSNDSRWIGVGCEGSCWCVLVAVCSDGQSVALLLNIPEAATRVTSTYQKLSYHGIFLPCQLTDLTLLYHLYCCLVPSPPLINVFWRFMGINIQKRKSSPPWLGREVPLLHEHPQSSSMFMKSLKSTA